MADGPHSRLLEGRTALVTGAAQGLGYAIAQRFAREGASVVVADLDPARARDAAAGLGGDAIGVGCDVVDPGQVQDVVDQTVERWGRIDVLVNNAGFLRDASMRKMSEQDFDAVINVHVKGAWNGIRAVAEPMRAAGGGSIICMSSISGKVGMFGQTNYSAAKAGVIGLTKASAKELARHGIRVNALMPALIRTAMTLSMPPEIFAAKEKEIPMGRAGEPEEVASAALFLASDLSSYVTGTVLEVTGGRHM